MGQFLCPLLGVFHCTHSNGVCHTGLLTACEQDQDGTAAPSWSCSQAVSKPVWHITLLCVQWKTPDDGQRNCPTHVEFYSKNKFEKLVHLVGFILRKYYPRSPHLVLLFCLEQYRPLHFGNLQAWPDVSGADLPPRNLVLQIGDALLVKGCLALS